MSQSFTKILLSVDRNTSDNKHTAMKKLIFTIATLLWVITLSAQDPDFALDYQLNHNLINPAYLTKNNFITANISFNRHWIYPGAPTHGTIWMSGKFTQHMGMGIQVSTKAEGLFRKTLFGATYAFDITIDKRSYTYLSFGINGALFQDFYNTERMTSILSDPFLSQARLNRYYPQVGAGVMLYSDNYEIGFAALRLLPYSGYFFGNMSSVLPPVFILHGSYFYKDPLDRYRFMPDFILGISKDRYYLEANLSSFNRAKTFKYGGGLSGDYIPGYRVIRINLTTFVGFRISERLFIIYKFDFHSINRPVPLLTKVGNSIAIRLDFYAHRYDIPEIY